MSTFVGGGGVKFHLLHCSTDADGRSTLVRFIIVTYFITLYNC